MPPAKDICNIYDDLSDSSTEDSFLLYKNMQRLPNVPMPVFKKPSKKIFRKVSPSMARLRRSDFLQLIRRNKDPLISSTPMNPSLKTAVVQVSPLQLSPITATRNSILAGNFEHVKQPLNTVNGILPKVSMDSNSEVEFRMSKSYDSHARIKQVNTSVKSVVEHLKREIAKKKRKSIGNKIQRKSNGVLKKDTTVSNPTAKSANSHTVGEGTASPEVEQEQQITPDVSNQLQHNNNKNYDCALKGIGLLNVTSEESIKLLKRKLDLQDDSSVVEKKSESALNKSGKVNQMHSKSVEIVTPKQNASQHIPTVERLSSSLIDKQNISPNKSMTLRSSSQNALNDAVLDEFLENFDAEMAAQMPSIISISSASENMSFARTSIDLQETSQLHEVNTSKHKAISSVHPKITNNNKIQNNHSKKSPKKEHQNMKDTSELNISYKTRSSKSSNNKKDETSTKEPEGIQFSTTGSNNDQHHLENIAEHSSRSESTDEIKNTGGKRLRKPTQKVKEMKELHDDTSSRNSNTSKKVNKETNTKRSKRKIENLENVHNEPDESQISVKKSKPAKTKSKDSKSKKSVGQNATAAREDEKPRGSRKVSTVGRRTSKASTSKPLNLQPYFHNRVSGFVQIEHGHPTLNYYHETKLEGERRSTRHRRPPVLYIQSTVVGTKPKRRTTQSKSTARESTRPRQTRSKTSTIDSLTTTTKSIETFVGENEDVFKKPILRSAGKKQVQKANKHTNAITKPTGVTMSETIPNETNQTNDTEATKNHDSYEIDSGACTMSKEISSRIATVGSSPMPSCSHWNVNAPVNTIIEEPSSTTTAQSPSVIIHENIVVEPLQSPSTNLERSSLTQAPVEPLQSSNTNLERSSFTQAPVEPLQSSSTNLERSSFTQAPTQININSSKTANESFKKTVTCNNAPVQNSERLLAKTLFPACNERNSELLDLDNDNQHSEDKDSENNKNAGDEGHDQDTLYTLVNNEVIAVDWISKMPPHSSKSSGGVTVTYLLNNLRSAHATSSCGYIKFEPGHQKMQITKKHCITYKVEQGQAVVSIQLKERNVGVGSCFYIPLGSTYSIRNLSQTEPLILYFYKLSA